MKRESGQCELSFRRPTENTLLIRIAGGCKIDNRLPATEEVEKQLESAPEIQRIVFDTHQLTRWDSGLLTFLIKVMDRCSRRNIEAEKTGLPHGVQRLLALSAAVPEKDAAHKEQVRESFLSRVGEVTVIFVRSAGEMLAFIGEVFLALMKLFTGKARFRRPDFVSILQKCGANALPIVSLISVLVGLILAFIGAIQLRMFGAQIYVADLVGIAMAREMGAMMTAIIMAGRTGAAFAAQLGTMTVNEEIDALTTLGISPVEFLVLPRMLALVLMMPLLCLYADFMGILGGIVVATGMLDLSFAQYLEETRTAITLTDFSIGLIKSGVFAVIVAISGCFRGMQCGRSASAVGDAATSAVVTAIVSIIVSDALFAIVTEVIGV